MKTKLMRSSGGDTPWSFSTAQTCPTISPAVRFRFTPSSAVKQNWQSTAHPTWLEIQIVDRPRFCPCPGLRFWVAPRLSAATDSPFSKRASAPEGLKSTNLSATSPASLPSPASPPSPSGIQTVSTLCPSSNPIKYRTVPSTDTNLFSICAPHSNSALLQPLTKLQRQSGNLLQRFHPLPVHRIHDLLGAIARFTRLVDQNCQFLTVHA